MTMDAVDEFFAEWKCFEKHGKHPKRVKLSQSFLKRLADAGQSVGGDHICGIPFTVIEDVSFE